MKAKIEQPESLAPKEINKLKNRIAKASTPDERDYLTEYLKMYRSMQKLVRKAYKECMDSKGGRGYYAFCALLSSHREIIADIRVLNDFDQHASIIKTDILQTYSTSVAQGIIDMSFHLRKLFIDSCEKKYRTQGIKTLDKLIADLAGLVQNAHVEACQQVDTSFAPTDSVQPRKRKKQ